MSVSLDGSDWLILFNLQQDNHIEASEERPKKTKLFFAHAADTWDAEFYVKVNDDVYVKIGKNCPYHVLDDLHWHYYYFFGQYTVRTVQFI